jgi:hypothetical protein
MKNLAIWQHQSDKQSKKQRLVMRYNIRFQNIYNQENKDFQNNN